LFWVERFGRAEGRRERDVVLWGCGVEGLRGVSVIVRWEPFKNLEMGIGVMNSKLEYS